MTALDALMAASELNMKQAHGLKPHEVALLGTRGVDYGLSQRGALKGWPAAVASLDAGDGWIERWFLRLFGARFVVPDGVIPAAMGMFDCASGISTQRRRELEAKADPLFNRFAFSYYDAICPAWNVPELSDEFRAGENVTVPLLLTQGTHDTANPLTNALETAQMFPNSHIIIIENGTHGAFVESLQLDNTLAPVVFDWLDGKPPSLTKIVLPKLVFDPIPD